MLSNRISSLGLFICEQNDRELNGEVCKILVSCDPVINSVHVTVIVLVARNLAVLQIMQLFQI